MEFKEQLLKDFPRNHVYSNQEIDAEAAKYVAQIKKDILDRKSSGRYNVKKKLFGGKSIVFCGALCDPIVAKKSDCTGVTQNNVDYFWKCVHKRLAEEGLGHISFYYCSDTSSYFDRDYVISFDI